MTDPIADMLTVIRNGIMVRREKVDTPHSKVKVSILEILRQSNFIDNYEVTADGNKKRVQINILVLDVDCLIRLLLYYLI